MKSKQMPSVVEATYEAAYRLRLVFSDGSGKTVDFAPWLKGPVFQALKDPAYFRRFFLDAGTVGWPNGADIAPEALLAARDVARSTANIRRGQAAVGRRSR